MEVTILGKYGPFATNGGSTSGYLVQSGNDYAMLDVGSGTVSKMLSLIDIKNLKFLFLSHLHYDHVSDIGVLSYAISFLKRGEKLNVYYFDDNSEMSKLLKGFNCFNLIPFKEGETYFESSFTFSVYKMAHPVPSHGIKITNGTKTLSYTGDTTLNDNLDGLIKNSNLLIADSAFIKADYSPNKPHMSVSQVANLASKYKIKTILSHISYNYSDEEVLAEIKNNKYTAIAIEGKTYNL